MRCLYQCADAVCTNAHVMLTRCTNADAPKPRCKCPNATTPLLTLSPFHLTTNAKVLADLSTLGLHAINEPQAVVSKDEHATGDESKVVARLANVNLAKQDALGVPDGDAVVDARPHVAGRVAVDAVRRANVGKGKGAAVGKALAVDDVECVDGAGARVVELAPLRRAGVGHVQSLFVGREFETVGFDKAFFDG